MLASLVARSFRNLESLEWSPGTGRHLLLGDNGAGKTSLLEAIYVLASTRSFRTHQIADCRRHDADFFFLEGEVGESVRKRLKVVWQAGRRSRAVNDKVAPLAEHLAVLPLVVWTAADADLLTGPPAGRRRLLDRGVLGLRPAALDTLSRYRQALAQKRRLLQEGGRGIEPWNSLLAAAAAELIELRGRYVQRLAVALTERLAVSGLPYEGVELAYRPSPADGSLGSEVIEERLTAAASRERLRRMPLVGPHRDDLEIRWGGHAVGRVASAGERKALGLIVAAAHGKVLQETGLRPTYLLDDLDAELAVGTLAKVWRAIDPPAQLFASSNRPEVWEGLQMARAWHLEKGRVEAR